MRPLVRRETVTPAKRQRGPEDLPENTGFLGYMNLPCRISDFTPE